MDNCVKRQRECIQNYIFETWRIKYIWFEAVNIEFYKFFKNKKVIIKLKYTKRKGWYETHIANFYIEIKLSNATPMIKEHLIIYL